jgi:glycosyltransferase involved in cell wall biosynthesis
MDWNRCPLSSESAVIATRVGSIPIFVSGAAILVNPNDKTALVEAIHRVIRSPEQRQKMIIQGRRLASEVTLETQVRAMVEQMQSWIDKPS